MKPVLLSFAAVILVALTGCKIVENKSEAEIPAGPGGDDLRNAIRLDKTFEAALLPLIQDNALPVTDLRALVTDDLDAAGAERGNRGSGRGAAWNFPVTGEGAVVEAKLDTRARWIGLDTDKDGSADVTVQLGPVIRGTALRDVAPFYNFDEFRDQIEFAKLARALNDRIKPLLTVPEGELKGARVRFTGVVPLKSADEGWVVTPVGVEFFE